MPNTIWLAWDSAVSILGHDVEIKRYYEAILKSKNKPKVLFDVGANYGTHSLLFSSQGVKTFSFEPNPNCYPHFIELFKANALSPNIVKKAVGNAIGSSILSFPETETWNGSIDHEAKNNIQSSNDLKSINVDTTSLDIFTETYGVFPDLIKIDTEGFEINVLSGAEKVLTNTKPIVIFESNSKESKLEIFEKLNTFDYSIYEFKNLAKSLTFEMFLNSKYRNFVACYKTKTLI